MTVRRALLAAGVIMRSPHDRRNQAPGANWGAECELRAVALR